MAIRIGGTTVIDDSRNLCNANLISATTVNATTVCGTTVCGAFCGSLGAISASNLTGIPAADQYICMVACEAITAGQPVSGCNCKGVQTTKGGPPFYCIGAAIYCDCCCMGSVNRDYDVTAISFACCPNCFVTVQFQGGGVDTSNCGLAIAACGPFTCIRVHNIASNGAISTACLCCFNYGPTCAGGLNCIPVVGCITLTQPFGCRWGIFGTGLMPLPSCTGSQGGVYLPTRVECVANVTSCTTNSNGAVEYYFCYCTATCTISLTRHCHGTGWGCGNANVVVMPYVTSDRQYMVGIVCLTPGGVGATAAQACADVCTGLYVKRLNDSMCLLSWPMAATCTGVTWKDVLPASCAYLSASLLYRTCDGACLTCNQWGGTGFFSQGADQWTINYYNTCWDASSNPYGKIWAYKPVADNCYAMSNIICPHTCTYIPYCMSSVCNCCVPQNQGMYGCGIGILGSIMMDEGGFKKMYFQQTSYGGTSNCTTCACFTRMVCFCVAATTLSYVSYSDGIYNWTCCPGFKNNLNFTSAQDNYGAPGICGYVCQYGYCGGTSISPMWTMYHGNMWSIYAASVPVCYSCNCFAYHGYCEVLLGREGCCMWWTGATDNHGVYGWACTNACSNLTGMLDQINVLYFRPQGAGPHLMNATCCGGTGTATGVVWANNKYPFLNTSNTYLTVAHITQAMPRFCCCKCGGIMSARIGYSETTVCNWYGIAQNSAAAGANVCIAVPGMVDRSPFSAALSSYVGDGVCLPVGFNCSMTVSTPKCTAFMAAATGISTCGRFCNYGQDILFKPMWDAGKGCYVTQILLKNTWSGGYGGFPPGCSFTGV